MDASAGDPNFCNRNVSPSDSQKLLDSFWRREIQSIQNMTHVRALCFVFVHFVYLLLYMQNDFRNPELPLARIKKIMKLDEDVKVMLIFSIEL